MRSKALWGLSPYRAPEDAPIPAYGAILAAWEHGLSLVFGPDLPFDSGLFKALRGIHGKKFYLSLFSSDQREKR
jgi:hypothetical protein